MGITDYSVRTLLGIEDDNCDDTVTSTNGERKLHKRPRRNRTVYSDDAIQILEEAFIANTYPTVQHRQELAHLIDMDESRVQVWFQNRRARLRRKKIPRKNGEQNEKKTESESSIMSETSTGDKEILIPIDNSEKTKADHDKNNENQINFNSSFCDLSTSLSIPHSIYSGTSMWPAVNGALSPLSTIRRFSIEKMTPLYISCTTDMLEDTAQAVTYNGSSLIKCVTSPHLSYNGNIYKMRLPVLRPREISPMQSS